MTIYTMIVEIHNFSSLLLHKVQYLILGTMCVFSRNNTLYKLFCELYQYMGTPELLIDIFFQHVN